MFVEMSKCSFAVKILTLSYPENVVQVRTLKRMKEREQKQRKNMKMMRKLLRKRKK
jgi:hypothetical protein